MNEITSLLSGKGFQMTGTDVFSKKFNCSDGKVEIKIGLKLGKIYVCKSFTGKRDVEEGIVTISNSWIKDAKVFGRELNKVVDKWVN